MPRKSLGVPREDFEIFQFARVFEVKEEKLRPLKNNQFNFKSSETFYVNEIKLSALLNLTEQFSEIFCLNNDCCVCLL